MNMLADADLPEADDEFSYREDPGLEGFPRPTVPTSYNQHRFAELIGKAKAANAEAARLLAEYRARHPLLYVRGTGMDSRKPGRLAADWAPEWVRNPVIPLPTLAGYRPYDFVAPAGAYTPEERSAICATARSYMGHPYRPDRFETRDSAPLPKRVPPPPTRCPICRALSAVLSKVPGRKS